MRKKALLVVASLVLILAVYLYLRRNALLESAIESAGTRVVGARVELDGLNLDIFGLGVRFQRLQITNPRDTWHNWLELGPSGFRLEWKPLLWNRYVIHEFYVREIRFNSPRERDGAIPGAAAAAATGPSLTERARRSLEEKLARTPIPDLARLAQGEINVDSLVAALGLTTPDSVEQLVSRLDETARSLSDRLRSLDPKTELDQVAELVAPIRPADIRTLEQLTDALRRVRSAQEKLRVYRSRFDSTRVIVQMQLEKARRSLRQVDRWAKADLARLQGQVGLPSLRTSEVAQMLFGPSVVNKALSALHVVELARRLMPYTEKAQAIARAGRVQKPPRGKGLNVRFPVTERWPKWLLRKAEISAVSSRTDTARAWSFEGQIENVTGNPKVLGRPALLRLKGRTARGARLTLNGVLDHTGDTPLDQFELIASSLDLGEVELPRSKYFPSVLELRKSDSKLNFELSGERLRLAMLVRSPEARFLFSSSTDSDPVEELVRSVFEDVRNLDLEAELQGPVDDLSIRLRSNLDVLLSRRLRTIVGQKVAQAQAQLESRVEQETRLQRQRLEKWYDARLAPIADELEQYRRLFEERDRLLKEKERELERRIEEEKRKRQSEAEKAAREKLQDLLKKKLP